MDDPNDRVANLLATLSTAVVDRVDAAAGQAAGHGAAALAALVTLEQFLDGGTIDDLRQATGLTHSGAVRLVDRLEADGLLRRRAAADRRAVSLTLTAKGRRAAGRVRDARRDALTPLLSSLAPDEAATLDRLLTRLVELETAERLRAREAGDPPAGWLCRLCDPDACGRPDGECPAQQTVATSQGAR